MPACPPGHTPAPVTRRGALWEGPAPSAWDRRAGLAGVRPRAGLPATPWDRGRAFPRLGFGSSEYLPSPPGARLLRASRVTRALWRRRGVFGLSRGAARFALRCRLSPPPPPASPSSVSPRSLGSAHARPGVSPPAPLRALCSCHPGWPGQPAPGPGGRGPPPGASPAASWPWPCGAVASFLGPQSPLQQAFSTPAQPASVKRPVRASLVGDTKRRCRLPALPGPGASAS